MTLLTSAETAERLRTTARQVTILCARGDLRATKSGRQWLVAEDDITAYLTERANRTRRPRRRRAA